VSVAATADTKATIRRSVKDSNIEYPYYVLQTPT
jgi:hypothetical protein